MPRTTGQKRKLWEILTYLQSETDETHGVTMAQILAHLREVGIEAERKSVYDDLAVLEEMGYEVEWHRGQGYTLLTRTLEWYELRLLADAVSASRFVTEKKSRELIGKLGQLTSRYHAASLGRERQTAGLVKTDNESVYYNIDALFSAMEENRQVSFRYFHLHTDHTKRYSHDDCPYIVSPWQLQWDEEKYYLLACVDGESRSFRVDRMENVTALSAVREGAAVMEPLVGGRYAGTAFGMFGGEPVDMSVMAPNRMVEIFFDRFGHNLIPVPAQDGCFVAHFRAVKSEQFFGWLAGLGREVRLVSPAAIVTEYADYLTGIAAAHRLRQKNQ